MEYKLDDINLIAKKIALDFSEYKIFAINGEMGAGKTTFSKAFCTYLEVNEDVSSPTFAIANIYTSNKYGEINHFDFYRLENAEEAIEIGLDDYLYSGNYCLMEWSEIIKDYIPRPYVEVNIKHGNSNSERIIETQIID